MRVKLVDVGIGYYRILVVVGEGEWWWHGGGGLEC